MPIQISTHVFKHYDTVMEDTIALQQMIESSATTAGANHHYFFIGEQHSANVDIQRREALASRIEYLDNITRVVERGMALDSEKGVVKEADLTSGPFAPARNVGLAKQIIEANAKSRNRVTVIFCGSDHDVRIKEQIVVAYQSDPTFRSAAWVGWSDASHTAIGSSANEVLGRPMPRQDSGWLRCGENSEREERPP